MLKKTHLKKTKQKLASVLFGFSKTLAENHHLITVHVDAQDTFTAR